MVRLCGSRGESTLLVDEAEWAARRQADMPIEHEGTGRELFAFMRHGADGAQAGASAMRAAVGL